MEKRTHAKSKSNNRLVDDINNFDRKPYPAFEIRDTLSDIPYVDSQQSVKVDELNGWIHIKPKLLRHGQTFEYKGQKYIVRTYGDEDPTFTIDTLQ